MSETETLSDQSMAESTDINDGPKKLCPPSTPESLPIDVQEEIECLYEFVPEVAQHFRIVNKIGEGTFSSVFQACLRHHPEVKQQFALKHIIPTSHPSRIEGELRCLQEIGGCENVIGVELCIRNRDHVVIVMPYFAHDKFPDYVLEMSLTEVRDYMRNLLIALRRVHKFDIIHRDVKPSNFLYNRETKQFSLVDFGLAHQAPVCLMKKCKTSPSVDVKLSDKHKSVPLSPSKKYLQDNNVKSPASTDLKREQPTDQKPGISGKLAAHRRQYTPPTANLDMLHLSNKIKSPRRMLLAKRALMIKEGQVSSKQRSSSSSSRPGNQNTCQCFGQPMVCSICVARSNQTAPRAGTPGFRSPEVLMKCPDQSTAVDIWSAGVIFLSLLSGRYPFFRANDDVTALAQIISIMGSEEVKVAAKTFGKHLTCSPVTPAVDLKRLCVKLRSAPSLKTGNQTQKNAHIPDKENSSDLWENVSDSCFDLLKRLLDLNPAMRITAEEALRHPFFVD
ncbi:cell division cycle 7-related protein kinase-like [Haliotis asinina]|uniref:cell division cycle 7-related protein kinase-like n=1 Tax=Haliotis asinina TaxID=109174 RepID=UPI003531D0FD